MPEGSMNCSLRSGIRCSSFVVIFPFPQRSHQQISISEGSMADFDPYVDLKQQLANGEVCAFVGAGLSVGAGLPGWYDLISQLSQRIGYKLAPAEWATSDTLIDAAQAYVNSQGLNSLITFLRRNLDSLGKSPTAAHQALARLPIKLVFTANYDDLLERAFRDAGRRVNLVTKDTYIPYIEQGGNVVNVLKLWGDLDQPELIVLTREQYGRFFLERPQLVKLLEVQLGLSTMLYLGWSHRDPHFNLIFGEMLASYGGNMKPGYAAMFDVDDAQRAEFKRKQIRPVELPGDGDRSNALAAWLNSLAPEPALRRPWRSGSHRHAMPGVGAAGVRPDGRRAPPAAGGIRRPRGRIQSPERADPDAGQADRSHARPGAETDLRRGAGGMGGAAGADRGQDGRDRTESGVVRLEFESCLPRYVGRFVRSRLTS